MRPTLRLLASAAVLGLPAASVAAAEARPLPGKKVMAVRPDVVLREAAGNTAAVSPEPVVGRAFEIRREAGEWIELSDGWAPRADLVPCDTAVDYFTSLLGHAPPAFVLVSRSRAWLEQRQPRRAISDADAALRAAQRWAPAHLCRAEALGALRAYPAAAAEATHAIALDPHLVWAYRVRANIRVHLRDPAGALNDLEAALRLSPNHPVTLWQRAMIFRLLGDEERAIQDLMNARWQPRGTGEYLDRALAATLVGRAKKTMAQTQFKQALVDLDEAFRLDPTAAGVHGGRCVCLCVLGNERQAKRELQAGIAAGTGDGTDHAILGLGARMLGEHDAALEQLSLALRMEYGNPGVYLLRGQSWLAKGETERAIADFDLALQLDPELNDAWNDRAVAHFRRGEYRAAKADFSRAARLAPRQPLTRANLAVASVVDVVARPWQAGSAEPARAAQTPSASHVR